MVSYFYSSPVNPAGGTNSESPVPIVTSTVQQGQGSVPLVTPQPIPVVISASPSLANSLVKVSVKCVLIGSACYLGPTLFLTAAGIKGLIVGGLFLYSGAVDNLINCFV